MATKLIGRAAVLAALAVVFAAPTATGGGKVGADCSFGAKRLYGKVQKVNAFADVKVQVVSSFPDLKVQLVNAFPDACGKWEYVNAFPDFTVQFVNSFPDVKVEFVNSFPGVP